MRKILIVVALLAGFVADAQLQTGKRQPVNGKGFEWKEGKFDSLFIPPRDTFRVLSRDSNGIAIRGGCLYVHTSGAWQQVWCFGGTTTPPPPSPLIVVTNPVAQSKQVGESVTFTAAVSGGTAPYSWQWQFNSTNIPGATTSSYNIPSVAYADSGNYRAVASDAAAATVTTTQAKLTVTAPIAAPQITYGYSSTDPFTNTSTAPTVSNPTTITITNNADLSLIYPAAAVDKYLIVKVPSSQSTKNTWFVESANQGSLGDAAWRLPFTVGGFTYYVTRDAAGFTFNYTLPVQLRQ